MGKSKRRGLKTKHGDVPSKEVISIDELMKKAEEAIDCFNYEEAAEKLNEILAIDSNNTKCLEILASVHLEQSNWLEAIDLLKRCVQLEPNEGYTKYFSLGQMHESQESLLFYQKGIEVLEKSLENFENIEPTKEKPTNSIMRSLSDAYCSIAELYMTDLCFEENAENSCVSAIEAAVKSDSSNSEAYRCQTNYLITKDEIEEATKVIKKCLSLWLPQHEALRDGDEEAISQDFESLIPSFDSRIQTSKLLIELKMYDEATKILDGLIEEDDEVVEVWYLLGWMNYIQGDEYMMNAHYYLSKAKETSAKVGLNAEEADYVTHVEEMLEELKVSHPLIEVDDNEDLDSNIASESDSEEKMEL